MQKTITCVLGNQRYEMININGRKLLVIYGQTPGTSFAIIPGWWNGNERFEQGQLAAIDVELVDPMDQMMLENQIKERLPAGASPGSQPRISFWGSKGIADDEEIEKLSGRPTILIVDDDPAIREIIRMYLEKEGFKVKTANSASQAETVLSQEKLPSLMLLDIMMPGGTGWELLKKLEGDPRVSRIPVIAISGLERPAATNGEHDSKMLYDYLVKPFSLAELSRVVRKFAQPSSA